MFFILFRRRHIQIKSHHIYNKPKFKYIYFDRKFLHNTIIDDVPTIALTEMKKSLKSCNISFFEGHTCLLADCPLCDNKSKLYINKTTGLFICENCEHTGSWNILEKFIVQKKSSRAIKALSEIRKLIQKEEDYFNQWNDLKNNSENVADITINEYEKLRKTFSFPNIPQETMSHLNCLYNEKLQICYFPLMAFNTRIVGYRSLSIKNEFIKTEPSTNTRGVIIHTQKSTKLDDSAVIVPTINDFLILIAEKSAPVIICLPYDLQNLPQEILPSLEKYDKLILWFGNNATNWDVSRNFAKKLNEKRCFIVRPIDQQRTPKEALKKKLNLKEIIQKAQPIWHKSITTFSTIRQDVLSDLQNIDKVQGVKWKRYPTLNRILKGHRKGEFTILTGPTGCGKTTFISEYSLDLAQQGVNTLWGSFEIRNARLARTMLQQMVGVPLDENLQNFNNYADTFEKLPIYFMTFHGQQNIKIVMEAVEHATYVHDISHVIIDNVQFMMGVSDESKHMDRFWRQDKIISTFRTFATKHNCHVTLVIHPRKERNDEELSVSSIFGSAKASQEADNVLIIQDKRLTSLRGKKYLQVVKNRYSGDLGIMLLEFDKSSLSYSSKKKLKSTTDQKDTSKEDIESSIATESM
ncbi:mitochondrial DNA helicase [Leptopilina boulardi]|uniref:mitochondrial DNA helicase n=1 Tax=Leptopilina boulardi TaxID=63433 RepID=UPI0021F594DF|nr:mitochondrial DNA helicase [Leptopilina boulardi]